MDCWNEFFESTFSFFKLSGEFPELIFEELLQATKLSKYKINKIGDWLYLIFFYLFVIPYKKRHVNTLFRM